MGKRRRRTLRLAVAAAVTVSALAALAPGAAAADGAGRAGCHGYPAVRQVLRQLTGPDGIAGAAVQVDTPGCGTWTSAAGTGDLRTGRPMSGAGRVRIGSNTKTFTATVLLQLVAEHRVDLNATVDHYLPGLIDRNGYDGRRITVRQLLQHTSGLPDHMDVLDWSQPGDWLWHDFTARELVALSLAQPPPEQPWSYSTTNYIVLGMIIGKVTGHAAADEITRRIIRPLGLKDTYWPGTDPAIDGPHPRGYEYLAGADGTPVLTDVSVRNMTAAGAGGALVSTLADESRFFAALIAGRLLPPAQLAQMETTVPGDPDKLWPGARYGLGLISTPLRCGGLSWGHGGTTPGFETTGGVAPDGRRVQLVLNQTIDTQQAFDDELAVVQTALCENR